MRARDDRGNWPELPEPIPTSGLGDATRKGGRDSLSLSGVVGRGRVVGIGVARRCDSRDCGAQYKPLSSENAALTAESRRSQLLVFSVNSGLLSGYA